MAVPSPEHLPRRAVVFGAHCAPPALPDEDRECNRLRDALVVTMASLSPRRRQILALAALGGLAPAAIATTLGMPLDVVGGVLEDAVTQVVSRLVA